MTADQTYEAQAAALDSEILECIARRCVPDFGGLALRVFAHQLRYNAPYARYCASLGVRPDAMPPCWQDIPPAPGGAFKEAALTTFEPNRAALTFETSGTTRGMGGKHYLETPALYDASLLAGFHDAMLGGAQQPLRYLLLVPNPQERPHSSLGYMMQKVAGTYGDGGERWFLQGDRLQAAALAQSVARARAEGRPLCVAGTAFAFVQLLDEFGAMPHADLRLPDGSRVMETGGFKGRTRIVKREQLYASLAQTFVLKPEAIVAEYGMTELCTQYYDVTFGEVRVKRAPPWLRTRVTGQRGQDVPDGTVGSLTHVDLANRSSCLAVQTEDLGVAAPDGGIILIGREEGAHLRGCSLDAEQLLSLK
ncbi:MAG: hypothetical protein ABR508_08320 [Candidatus Baltobacteraceae bacterium]